MKRIITVVCPYCGRNIKMEYDSIYSDYLCVICDVMDGGCDRPFVADVSVNIVAKGRKIEGEDDGNY